MPEDLAATPPEPHAATVSCATEYATAEMRST
jgi:hypothetical protein